MTPTHGTVLTMTITVDLEQVRGDIRSRLESLLRRKVPRGQVMSDAVTFLATIDDKPLRNWGADEWVRLLAAARKKSSGNSSGMGGQHG